MKEHKCYIGEWLDYEHTTLVTFEKLQEYVNSNNETYSYAINHYGFPVGQVYRIVDYFDRRKNTNFNHFNYCPYCGKKIDWKQLRLGVNAR